MYNTGTFLWGRTYTQKNFETDVPQTLTVTYLSA